MELPADQTDPIAVVNVINLQSPDRKPVRRRYVQSTLFPLKPHDGKVENSAKKEVKKTEEIEADGDDDDEEWCGSQGGGGGRRRSGKKNKRNATPQKRSSKKVAVNGKDASIVAVDDTESPDDGSPQKLKGKQRVSTRNGKANGNKGTSKGKVPAHPVATLQAPQPVPDLWLEAKKTAEENSRIFAGKHIHPFFSSWKLGKKDQETTAVENDVCLAKRQRNADIGPIHVFENAKDDLDSIDWSNWTFCDRTFSNTTCCQERMMSTFEGTVGSLNVDTILNTSNLLEILKEVSSGRYSDAHKGTYVLATSVSPIVLEEEATPYDLLKNIEEDFELNKLGFLSENIGHARPEEQQNAILQERIMSYYLNRGNHPENSLWTCKYQPEKSLEVCGNSNAVKFINEWLQLWHAADFRVSKKSSNADKSLTREDDCDSYDSDSDVENVNEASGLKNVLLVTGPVGSGKSAAIYACAKEQGFQILEVNASDWRNGALLKQKFGEAVGSHWLKRSQESPMGSQNKLNLNSSQAVCANTNEAADIDLNGDVVEVIPSSDEEESVAGIGTQCARNGRIPCDQGEIKTLILFEDVDANLCEDRGFISTIQQLADTGKRPMILTSNSENPVLPDNLDREEVCFTMPPLQELLRHIYLVCAAEKAIVQPQLIERCIQFCGGDIRKTLMHLQFWCQSKGCVKDGEVGSLYSPLMFNLEAGHCTLPKLIPWELPSPVSEFVEAEIAKSLRVIEENHSLLEVIEEEVGNDSTQNSLDIDNGEKASVEAKKEAILRGNCFLDVENDIATVGNTFAFSNSADSPVAFTRRNVRRKLVTVMSDSEDEIPYHENTVASDGLRGDDNNSFIPEVDNNTVTSNGDLVPHSGAAKVEVVRHQTSEVECVNHIKLPALDDSSNQSTDHFVHFTEANLADNQQQIIESVNLNHTSWGAANDSLYPLRDQLLQSGDGEMEMSRHQFPVIGHVPHNFASIGNYGNLLTDQQNDFREANAVKIEVGAVNGSGPEAENHCLNPLRDQLQDYGDEKMAVKRCLFLETAQADPVCCAVGSSGDQSTIQLIHCGEANMAETQHQHMEMGIGNHSTPETADESLKPLFNLLQCHGKANTEDVDHQLLETANVYPFTFLALGDSLNPSSHQMFQSMVPNREETQHRNAEAGSTSHIGFPTMGDSWNELSGRFFDSAELQGSGNQHCESTDVNHANFPPADDCSKQKSEQIHFEETKRETNSEDIQHQFVETANIDLISCPAVGKSTFLSTDQALQSIEANSEGHQCPFSEATNVDHNFDRCQSIDMSCVPESTFVPETEVNDGTELPSRADLIEIVSPVIVGNVDSPLPRYKNSEHIRYGGDINLNVKDEEMGDSQSESEHLEASTSGCQVMDECSRMDFCKRYKSPRSSKLETKNPVQEMWTELRQTDLRQHFISEHKNAPQVLTLAYGISNLISEADLLLQNCKFLINDSLDQEIDFSEETVTFGWHDQQVHMTSAISEHGYRLYAKDIDTLQSKMGIDNRVHLAWEMLASTSNSTALGKLLRLDGSRSHSLLAGRSLTVGASTNDISSRRERQMSLENIVQSIVPPRSYLAVRGNALPEYLSSLALISRSEASRLAEGAKKTKRRRVRTAKNYLSSGALDLSLDDISLLTDYNCYGKVSSEANCAISGY